MALKALATDESRMPFPYPAATSASQHAKNLELDIHADALMAAKARLSSRTKAEFHLGVLDDAGAYGLLDAETGEWKVVVPAEIYDARALFTKVGDEVKASPKALCQLTQLNLNSNRVSENS